MEQKERVKLSLSDAVKMLPEGDTIHTFRSGRAMLIGADWSRIQIITAMEKFGVELSGPSATFMNHGLVLKDETGHLFIETKR